MINSSMHETGFDLRTKAEINCIDKRSQIYMDQGLSSEKALDLACKDSLIRSMRADSIRQERRNLEKQFAMFR